MVTPKTNKMLITDEKIKVTYDMMNDANMVRGIQLGVPVDPKDKNKGLRWKDISEFTENDYDAIEEYFLNKNK